MRLFGDRTRLHRENNDEQGTPILIAFAGVLVQKRANTEDDGLMQRFAPLEELFNGRHFDQEIVVLCVLWYLRFKLSYRDLVSMMAERAVETGPH
jgi:hypothetical protein